MTVLYRTPQRDIKDSALTFRHHVNGTNPIRDTMAHKTPVSNMIFTRQTFKADHGQHNTSGAFENHKREDNRHLTTYGEIVNNLK